MSDKKDERKPLESQEVEILVVKLANVIEQMDRLKSLKSMMDSQMSELKQRKEQLRGILGEEMEWQLQTHGVAEIHPAVTTQSAEYRAFKTTLDDLPDDVTDKDLTKFVVMNESELGSIIRILMDSDKRDELISLDTSKLERVAKKSIPTWAKPKMTTSRGRKIVVREKLGEYLITSSGG